MKELIQNAEDAEAKHLDLILTPGDSPIIHPLLCNPALCSVNDRPFGLKHRDGIFRLGLGTKGAELPRFIRNQPAAKILPGGFDAVRTLARKTVRP